MASRYATALRDTSLRRAALRSPPRPGEEYPKPGRFKIRPGFLNVRRMVQVSSYDAENPFSGSRRRGPSVGRGRQD